MKEILEAKKKSEDDINEKLKEKESLEERGMSLDDLLELKWEDEDDDYAEKDSIRLVSRKELADIMDQQDVVLSF